MLVAAVAGVVSVVVFDVTGLAICPMVFVKAEVLIVLEGRWCPTLLRMARTAIALDLLVQSVTWINVATVALFLHGRLKQLM